MMIGAKLAGSVLRAGIGLTVLDLDAEAEAPEGADWPDD
jgi:hypothetical protein